MIMFNAGEFGSYPAPVATARAGQSREGQLREANRINREIAELRARMTGAGIADPGPIGHAWVRP